MLPITLVTSGITVLVVGGGAVGRSKAQTCLGAGASVRLIDLNPQPTAFQHDRLEWRMQEYSPDHLDKIYLVISAVPDEVGVRVVADAKSRGILVCDTRLPARGNFTLPAVHRAGKVTLAVSTGGASPHLAKLLKEKFQADFDLSFQQWVDLLAELRSEIIEYIADSGMRKQIFKEIASWHWLDYFRVHGKKATIAEIRKLIDKARNGTNPSDLL